MGVTQLASMNEAEAQDRSPPKLDVVICHDGPIWELDWYANALGDFELTVHRSPDFSLVIPGALYMLHGSLGFAKLPKAFLARVKAAGNCGVIHLGDEFFRGPYSIYGNFAYAIRTHFAEFLQSPLMNAIRWSRVVGDTILALGALAFVLAVARMTIGTKRPTAVEEPVDNAQLPEARTSRR